MKDVVMELVAAQPSTSAKLNAMREYLQAYLLRLLHAQGVFRSAAFVGGTALRFLHQLPRFSEDLDFSLVKKGTVPFAKLLKILKEELRLAGYEITVVYKESKAVQYAFVKFERLLFETGLSPLENQLFSVKIEIDSNPPAGAGLETKLVTKYFPLAFLTHDLPSLFSGKIHALLSRRYTKGRDYFDLGWYLSRWPDLAPNLPFLKNALSQTGWKGKMPAEDNWKEILLAVVEKTDWKTVSKDVVAFLERPSDMAMITKDNVARLLSQ